MGSMGDAVEGIIARSMHNKAPGDYIDPADGLLHCGVCHQPKQHRLHWAARGDRPARDTIVGQLCACGVAEEETAAEEARRAAFAARMDVLRRDGISDAAYLRCTFAADDGTDAAVARVCRRYADRWQEMRDNNVGILLYGGVGTGKTYMAACIANALLDRCIPASITNLPRLLNNLMGGAVEEKQTKIDRLQRYELLVIDDLGVERDNAWAQEQTYNIIDTRYRSGKPLIITTNMSMREMEEEPAMDKRRIYDRVLQMCPVRLKMAGESRRPGIAARGRELARELLK